MSIADQTRGAFDALANSRGRSAGHIAIGAGAAAGAVALSWLIARRRPSLAEGQPPPRTAFAAVWPPLHMALTLSGLRVWNAPASAARTAALGFWGMTQGLNAISMIRPFGRLGGRVAAAGALLGTAFAYAWQARRVDTRSADMVAPYLGWMSLAGVLGEGFRPRKALSPTLH